MKKFPFRGFLVSVALVLSPALFAVEKKPYAVREGDVVFSSSKEGQGNAVILATRSPYSHCGIVFEKDGQMMVLEAVQPVGVVSLKTFMSRSTPGTFMARRLKAAIPFEKYRAARAWAMGQIGKNYDGRFLWDDKNLYCSELVWKIYQQAGVELCKPRRFQDYQLDNPEVKALIQERFGSIEAMPKNEKIVAPSDLATSDLLEEVPRGS
jgi:uncharacterized protein YycO